jgi:hypothetical protein
MKPEEVAEKTRTSLGVINKVLRMMEKGEHKRKPAPIIKIT